jgi:hypothetical protein
MKPQKHTVWGATAAIAAALALSSSPLAAQSTGSPVADPPAAQPQPDQPAPPVAASPAPAPAVVVPDVAPPAASGASAQPDVQPSASTTATTTTRRMTTAPAPKTTATQTTVSRTTSVTHAAPLAAPLIANDAASSADTAVGADSALPVDTADAAPPVAANPDALARPASGIAGTMGVIALALLALIIIFVGFMFARRRSPVTTETIETPTVTHTLAGTTAPAAQPVLASQAEVMATPTTLQHRDRAPVRGALPSEGASIDLPAQMPESYEERSALLDKMVNAKPDKANPFTDRRARLHRARLIMQSLGHTFGREPRIDLSQYPNNWPELARQYHQAA